MTKHMLAVAAAGALMVSGVALHGYIRLFIGDSGLSQGMVRI